MLKLSDMRIKEIKDINGNDEAMLIQKIKAVSAGRNILPCTLFLNLSRWLNIDSREVGRILNQQNLKVGYCAFGCFPRRQLLVENPDQEVLKILKIIEIAYSNQITCGWLWKMTQVYKGELFAAVKHFKAQGVKITDCRLGFF